MGQDNHSGEEPKEPVRPPAAGPEYNDDGGTGAGGSGGTGSGGTGSAAQPPSLWAAPGAQNSPEPPSAWGPPASQPPTTPPLPRQPEPPQGWGQQWGQQWGQPGQQNPWGQNHQQWSGPGAPGGPGGPGAFPPGTPGQPWGSPGYLPQGGWTPPPKPGVIPLRPLGLGELLDGAFQACRKNAAATFGTALLIQGVIAVLTYLVAGSFFSSDLFSTDVDGSEFTVEEFESSQGSLGWSLTAVSLLGVVSVVGVLLLQGILVVPVARSILNLKTGFAQTWRLSRSRLLPLAGLGLLLLAAIVVGIVVFSLLLALILQFLGAAGIAVLVLGILALIAVFVWLAVKFALAPAALVLEPAGVFASLRRSWELTKRNFWRSFGILALTAILVSIVSSVISTPVVLILSFVTAFGSGSEPDAGTAMALVALNVAISTFFGAIGYAFQSAVTSLLYVDLRIRREGFDLTLMKEQELAGSTPDLVPGRRSGSGV